MTEYVIVNDVGPRDGLQNHSKILTPRERVSLIRGLVAAGVENVEVAAFVSPGAVPAMAGADKVVAGVKELPGNFSVLIPNMKGYELALQSEAETMAMVVYGTEGMAQANVKMSCSEANTVCDAIIKRSREDGIALIVTISVCFECPFEGPVDPSIIHKMTDHLLDQGAQAVVIADTIGAADPAQVKAMMASMVARHGAQRLACHFHDTRAMGLANVFAAVESGIRRFDASIGGLGGCPFAPGASGNVATEDVVMMLHQMGFQTGINMAGLMQASRNAALLTGNAPGGRAAAWLNRRYPEEN